MPGKLHHADIRAAVDAGPYKAGFDYFRRGHVHTVEIREHQIGFGCVPGYRAAEEDFTANVSRSHGTKRDRRSPAPAPARCTSTASTW